MEEWDWDVPRPRKTPGKRTSQAQARFLRRLFAQAAEDAKINCDCPGCGACAGFVPGCTCDHVYIQRTPDVGLETSSAPSGSVARKSPPRPRVHCETHDETHRVIGCDSTAEDIPF